MNPDDIGYQTITDSREIGMIDGQNVESKEYYALRMWGEKKR